MGRPRKRPIRNPSGPKPKHGARQFERIYRENALDLRTTTSKLLRALENDLVADHGGWDAATAAEQILVRRAAFLTVLCSSIENWVLGHTQPIVNNELLGPLKKGYATHQANLTRTLVALGVRPDRAEKLPSLHEYIAMRGELTRENALCAHLEPPGSTIRFGSEPGGNGRGRRNAWGRFHRGQPVTAVTNLPDTGCRHVTDDRLRHWYAQHPEVIEARCFHSGQPLPRHRQEETHDASTAGRLTGSTPTPPTTTNIDPQGERTMGYTAADLFPSRYLKAADLDGPTNFVIAKIEGERIGEEKELKGVLYFRGQPKGVVMNKTNFTMLARAYGADTDTWPGKPVTLVVESVPFRGDLVDAIRIRIPKVTAKPRPAAPPVLDDAREEPIWDGADEEPAA